LENVFELLTTKSGMRKNIILITTSALFVAAMAAAPSSSIAQDASAKAPAASDSGATAETKKKGETFLGNLSAVDTSAMTLTVSNLTLHVTDATVIKTGSKPAKLSEAVVGQLTRGTYKTNADGKLEALTVHLNTKAGSKGGSKSGKKKKDASESGASK
jgi:hypothetical protein